MYYRQGNNIETSLPVSEGILQTIGILRELYKTEVMNYQRNF